MLPCEHLERLQDWLERLIVEREVTILEAFGEPPGDQV